MKQTAAAHPAHAAAPALFASRAQILWLTLAVLAAVLCFGVEITHYIMATDVGALDQDLGGVTVNSHPGCTEQESKYDISCPLPGYNSIQLACGETKCGQRNQSLPPTSPQTWADLAARADTERMASLRVEQPYSKNDPDWRNSSMYLSSTARYVPGAIALDKPPLAPEDVQPLLQARQMAVFHATAQAWMRQHAR